MPQRHRWNIGAALTTPMFHRCCPHAVAAGSAEQPSVNSRALRVVLDDAGEIDPDLMSSLSKTCRRWVFTVCGETNNRSAIPRLVHPAAARRATASSAPVSDSQPSFGRSSDWTRRRIPSSRSRLRARAASRGPGVDADPQDAVEGVRRAAGVTIGQPGITEVLKHGRQGQHPGLADPRLAVPHERPAAAAGGQASSAAATDSVQQRSQQLDPGVPADQRPGITRGDGHQKTLRHEVSQMTYATSRPGRLPFRLTRF
jgi:hypothetical protein